MALYAIGDVQGCYNELCGLLHRIGFNPVYDEVWFTGDLVNRGPQSADVLRLVASFGDSAVSVLGNHDLHLLAVAAGSRRLATGDFLDDILQAPDREALLAWLMQQPLLHYDANRDLYLVHAGIPPQWNFADAIRLAREAEGAIRGNANTEFFAEMYGNRPNRWSESLSGWERLRFIVNALTRMRFCYSDGSVDYHHKGPPGSQPSHLSPWFKLFEESDSSGTVIFGHWSLLGLFNTDRFVGLDTGCVAGGRLTAVRLGEKNRDFVAVVCGRDAKQETPRQN